MKINAKVNNRKTNQLNKINYFTVRALLYYNSHIQIHMRQKALGSFLHMTKKITPPCCLI